MANLAKYIVQLEAQTAKYQQGLDAANRKLDKFHKDQTRALRGIASAFKGLVAAVGTVALGNYIKESINAADNANKLAQKIGIATESLTGLQLGLDLSGASMEDFEKGMFRLARASVEASEGVGAQAEAFAALGIGVVDAQGKLRPLESILRDVSDSFAGMDDGARKAALAQEVLGRSGAKLIPFLNAGAKGMDDVIERSRRLGLVWSSESAAAAEMFNDNLTILQAVARGLTNQFVQEMLPAMNDITAAMIIFAEEGSAVQKIVSAISFLVKSFSTGVIVIADGLETIYRRAVLVGEVLANVAVLDFSGAKAKIEAFNSDLEARFEQVSRQISVLWGSADKDLEGYLERQRQAILATFGTSKATTAAASAGDALKASIDKQISALYEEVAALGLAGSALKLFQLQQQGATEGQLLAAKAALESIEAYNELAEIQRGFADGNDATLARNQARIAELDEVKNALRTEEEAIRESYAARLKIIQDNTEAGSAEQQKLLERLRQQTDEQLESLKKSGDEMSEFSKRAAQNMQDAFADFLFNPFEDGVKGMVDGFLRALQRMAADALSAKILQALFGGLAGSSNSVLSSIGTAFGGARASGGPVSAGMSYMVGERGPEMFVPSGAGSIIPNGGGVSVQIVDQRGAGAPPVDVEEQMNGIQRMIKVTVRGELAGMYSDGSIDKLNASNGMSIRRRGAR